MSEDRFEQEEPKDETEDVEAHGKTAVTDEPASDDGSDDVEAHNLQAAPKQARPKQA